MPQEVPILIGSPNDREKVASAVKVLTNFGLKVEVLPMSAHRQPDLVREFARQAKQRGYRAIITGAGMSNGLSGMVAAHTRLPVRGVPLSGGPLNGVDAVLSTLDMPPGMPVATFPIDGAANAALDIIRQLALDDPVLDRKLRGFIERGSNVKAPMPDHSGKVSDTFYLDGDRFVYVSNRLSAFDRVLDDPIPGKGRVLSQLTKHWLTNTPVADVMSNHLIYDFKTEDLPDWAQPLAEQMMVTERLPMIKLECIVRGYLVGSAWREYEESGTMHGERLPEGMLLGQKLPESTFTPSTKADEGEHDENIGFDQACQLVGVDRAKFLREMSLLLFKTAQAYAAERGILILDTKFEFGYNAGTEQIVLADEVFTPDSSRFVDAATFVEGEEPLSMDKEYVRQWLLKESGWNPKDPEAGPPPPLPQHVIWETARRYEEILRRLTA